ncbi:MAG: right-handed parallel beta-helix repeat-containing protein [Gammaproteobacteria bacterium]|nr:right-handed parallel beta-helix repeat-containing protein [Gammaproteobacteria bacterium]MBU1416760.1 right-handed parallel beta-helix repeat-containing protein [Gammaproteobacteria bacterium]
MKNKAETNFRISAIVLLSLATLCGCGGGSSSSDDGASSTSSGSTSGSGGSGSSSGGQGSYVPPIGIPAPGFGIEESYRMYDDAAARNPALTYSQNSEGGYYTHYISDTGCTDSSNPYGTVTTPRCSVPTTIEEGSVVEVHGTTDGGQLIMTFNCTTARPCWFRGLDAAHRPLVRRETIVKGGYVILEHLHFDQGDNLGLRAHSSSTLHHAAVRDSELAQVNISGHAGYSFNNIVVYRNDIHLDNFVNTGASSPEFPENDTHGVATGSYSDHVWILDNDIHDVAGDAVGNAHGANYTAHHYYIGRNRLHDTGENSVDFKEIEYLVVSQNKAYREYGPSSGSDGAAMVFHYGPSVAPKNAWIIFNEIYDCADTGIQIGGDVTDPIYVIGNVIRGISNASGNAYAIRSWGAADVHLIGNVLYDNDGGIDITGSSPNVLNMVDNIVAGIRNASAYHLIAADTAYHASAVLTNNLFHQSGGAARIHWGAVYDVAGLQGNTGKCAGCIEGDPRFANPAGGDFSLGVGSPAIDAGIASPLYDQYQQTFGVAIQVDFSGTPRPVGAGWDMGAFERQ